MQGFGRLVHIGCLAVLVGCTPPAAPSAASRPPASETATSTAAAPAAMAPAAQPTATRAAPTVLRQGVPAPASSQWPYFVAERKGFLAEEGVEIDYNVMQTEARAMTALAGGSLDLITTTPGPTILAIERGANVRAIAGLQNRATYWLATARDVTQLGDLRGKVLGSDSLGSVVAMYMKRLLRDQAGLVAERDYDIVATGGIGERLVAVQAGQTAGTLLGPPFDLRAREAGLNLLADTHSTMRAQWTLSTFAQGVLDGQRPAAVGFVRAIARGAAWLYDPANRAEAIAILSERLNQGNDVSAANYDQLVVQLQAFTRDGSPDIEGVRTVLEMMADEGQVSTPPPPVSKYYDDQYLRAATAR